MFVLVSLCVLVADTKANKGVFLWLLFSIAVVLKSGCKSAKSSGMLQDGFHRKLTDKTTAAERLNLWYQEVKSAGFEQLIAVAETMESREGHVTNYFNNRHTNAAAESLNAKIKAFRSMLHGVSDRPFFMYRIATIFG